MATKKKAARRPSSTKKSTASSADMKRQEQHEKKSRQVAAIIYFAVGILIFALSIVPGESVWAFFHQMLFGLFGFAGYVVAPVLIYIAIMATLDRPFGAIKHKVWQSLLLLVLISSFIQIVSVGQVVGDNFIDKLVNLYESGVALQGGGLVSAIFAWPLLYACGQVGAAIIVALVVFIFVMLLTGTTLWGFLKGVGKPVRKITNDYAIKVEQREQERARKENMRFNIDVDLGPDPVMPEHPVSSPKPIVEEAKIETRKERRDRKRAMAQIVPEVIADEQEPSVAETTAKSSEHQPEMDELIRKAAAMNQSSGSSEKDANDPIKITAKQEPVDSSYVVPPISLLRQPTGNSNRDVSSELKANAERLVDTLKSFGVQTRVINVSRGPTVTRYELQPSAGVKISRITGLADDIALNLASAGVRIEAPIPNKPAVGIEVPNKDNDVVTMREIIESSEFKQAKSKLTVALGKDIAGAAKVADIAKMPHVLIAGSTGSGKSVCINSIIISLLYKSSPADVRFLMIDPKVVELGIYNGIPHLLVPVVTDPRKAAGALGWAVTEMLKRYKLFADNSVRDLEGYNRLAQTSDELQPMPQIVIIIDELADLMMAAPNEVEDSICRLAQMARAAGMHLVIATQRPSVDVITGVIKANIPSRIAFAVSSQVDSRTILDGSGAEKLLGRGDMLFYPVGYPKPVRVQGCFVTEKEVEQVVDFVKGKETADYDETIIEEIDKQAVSEKGKSASSEGGGFDEQDDMLQAAIECVIEAGQASTSYLQRKLKLGYARAARIIDQMEEMGIVGPFEGSKPRQVLMTRDQWLERSLNQSETKS